jgi:hypothetical protein
MAEKIIPAWPVADRASAALLLRTGFAIALAHRNQLRVRMVKFFGDASGPFATR